MKKLCYVVTIPLTVRAFFIPQIKYLSKHGYDVTVVCSFDDMLREELNGAAHVHFAEIPRGLSAVGSIKAIFSLKSFFKREHFDLIQYSTPNAALYAALAAMISGCKVRNYHIMGFRYLGASGVGKYVLKLLEKMTCRLSTSVECVSRSNMLFGISERLFDQQKATVVWNGSSGGVDLTRFNCEESAQWRNEIRQQLGLKKSDFVFGFVGRITRDKGINELLAAFNCLNSDATLLIVGNMENEATIDADLLQNANNNPKVLFHTAVDDIERYYAAMDVLVLPSYREGFGNVIIEAAAVGVPAIVSDIPGPTDAIEKGVTALTVQSRDAVALADAMMHIREMDCRKMGQDAAAYVRTHFDSVKLCEKILERKKALLSGCN